MQLNQIPRYKSVTLLQGPVGPFFKKFSKYLKKEIQKFLKLISILEMTCFIVQRLFVLKGK